MQFNSRLTKRTFSSVTTFILIILSLLPPSSILAQTWSPLPLNNNSNTAGQSTYYLPLGIEKKVDLKDATVEQNETFECMQSSFRSVWYSFLATAFNMQLRIRQTGPVLLCDQNVGIGVYQYTKDRPPTNASLVKCGSYSSLSSGPVEVILNLTGLDRGKTYFVQVVQASECNANEFAILLDSSFECATCANVCGEIDQHLGRTYLLKSNMNRLNYLTHCFNFTPTSSYVRFISKAFSSSKQLKKTDYSISYNLYTPACNSIASGDFLFNSEIAGLTVGTTYKVCFKLQAYFNELDSVYFDLDTVILQKANTKPVFNKIKQYQYCYSTIFSEFDSVGGTVTLQSSSENKLDTIIFLIDKFPNNLDTATRVVLTLRKPFAYDKGIIIPDTVVKFQENSLLCSISPEIFLYDNDSSVIYINYVFHNTLISSSKPFVIYRADKNDDGQICSMFLKCPSANPELIKYSPRVYKGLKRRKIYPNKDIVSLIYNLNPFLQDHTYGTSKKHCIIYPSLPKGTRRQRREANWKYITDLKPDSLATKNFNLWLAKSTNILDNFSHLNKIYSDSLFSEKLNQIIYKVKTTRDLCDSVKQYVKKVGRLSVYSLSNDLQLQHDILSEIEKSNQIKESDYLNILRSSENISGIVKNIINKKYKVPDQSLSFNELNYNSLIACTGNYIPLINYSDSTEIAGPVEKPSFLDRVKAWFFQNSNGELRFRVVVGNSFNPTKNSIIEDTTLIGRYTVIKASPEYPLIKNFKPCTGQANTAFIDLPDIKFTFIIRDEKLGTECTMDHTYYSRTYYPSLKIYLNLNQCHQK